MFAHNPWCYDLRRLSVRALEVFILYIVSYCHVCLATMKHTLNCTRPFTTLSWPQLTLHVKWADRQSGQKPVTSPDNENCVKSDPEYLPVNCRCVNYCWSLAVEVMAMCVSTLLAHHDYSALIEKRSRAYYDEYICLCVSVCLSASEHISETRMQTSPPNFLCMFLWPWLGP